MTKYTEKILRVREIISLDRVLMLVLFLVLVIGYQQSMGTESTVSFSPLYEGWQVHEDGSYIPLDKESYQAMKARNPITIKRALTKELEGSKNLIFYTKDTKVEVLFDHAPIYSYGYMQNAKGEMNLGSYGSLWHTVRLPKYAQEGDEIQLTFTPTNEKRPLSIPRIYTVKDYEFTALLLEKNRLSLLITFILLGFAFLSLGFYSIYSKPYDLPRGVQDLGLYVFLVFLWFITRNPWVQMVFSKNLLVLKLISYFSLSLLLIPYMYLFIHREGFPYPRCARVLVFISWCYVLVQLLAYVVIFVDVGRYASVDLIFRAGIQAVTWFMMIRYYRETKDKDILKLIGFGFVFFLFNGLDHVIDRFWPERFHYLASEIALLAGVAFLMLDNIRQAIGAHRDSILANQYRKLSAIDALTGLGNRNSYLSRLEDLKLSDHPGVIIMDINDLKEVNDCHGHLKGDELIIETGRLVNEVFGDSFEKFRIGGDEFAFLTQNKTAQYLEEHIWKFNKKLSDLNEKQQIPLKVAAGAHQYKPGVDESLQDIIHKADEQMYLQKIRMKM